MILIKDRHSNGMTKYSILLFGKYDTYKGSTQKLLYCRQGQFFGGKYDTYKGSTP